MYIPSLPGYKPRQLDMIYVDDGEKYTIQQSRTNVTDLAGTVCIVDANAP